MQLPSSLFHVRSWCESCSSRVNTCVRGRVCISADCSWNTTSGEKKKKKVSCPRSPPWTPIHYLSPGIKFIPTGVSVLNDTGPWQLATDAGDESEDQALSAGCCLYTHKHTYTCMVYRFHSSPYHPHHLQLRGEVRATLRWQSSDGSWVNFFPFFHPVLKEMGLKFWRHVAL